MSIWTWQYIVLKDMYYFRGLAYVRLNDSNSLFCASCDLCVLLHAREYSAHDMHFSVENF